MSNLTPDFEAFRKLTTGHTHVPVVATLICDDMTPVSAFARLRGGSEYAFLLESVIGGEKIARYSFLGAAPAATFHVRRETQRCMDHRTGRIAEQRDTDPLGALQQQLHRYSVPPIPGLPRFLGGAVGYASYDTIRYYENLPHAPHDDRQLADLSFDIYDTLVIFDHVFKVVHVVAHADITRADSDTTLRQAYDAAEQRIEQTIARLDQPIGLHPIRAALPVTPLDRYSSNFQQNEFERIVHTCKEYIRAGDIFQVVPSQRLQVQTPAHPFDVYRALRVINPSPFMFYLTSPELTLVGASPEIMCRVEDRTVTNRPLAGTRRRGETDEDDQRLRAELLADPKERAEHVMLVDLGRNDIGRVAKPRSIRLSDVMAVEYYSHVMHICTNVTGELADDQSAFDALRATLPVGTVTGAPKIRAMQIIDECETTRRGPYAGAVGYMDFAGNMDTCIALRTLIMQPAGDGMWNAFAQAGAGVVADSDPTGEYKETLNKAAGMLTALRLAEEQF